MIKEFILSVLFAIASIFPSLFGQYLPFIHRVYDVQISNQMTEDIAIVLSTPYVENMHIAIKAKSQHIVTLYKGFGTSHYNFYVKNKNTGINLTPVAIGFNAKYNVKVYAQNQIEIKKQ